MKKILDAVWQLMMRIMRAVLTAGCRLIGKELTEAQLQGAEQFVKFCLVGFSNTAISYLVYFIFVCIDEKLYLIGNAAGFVVSVLNSYFWNSKFVFKKQDERGKTIVKTFLAYGTNLVTGTLLLRLFVGTMGMSVYLAPLLNLLITVPMNYLLNKYWVMKPQKQREGER